MCTIMRRFIFYHEEQRLGFRLLGSESRCSISSRRVVLLFNGKKRGRKRLGVIFKSIGKFVLKVIDLVLLFGPLFELTLIIVKWLGW